MSKISLKRSKHDHKTNVIHSHPILDDECHDLSKIRIIDGNNTHIHYNVTEDFEHMCTD